MKKLLSVILVLTTFVVFCLPANGFAEDENVPKFRGMSDPALLPYIEDTVYRNATSSLAEQGYVVESVQAIYISQEYLDELAYNSQANIFFGKTLAELDAQFEGTRYVFTLGDDNETTAIPFEEFHDDTYEKVLRNVAIGAGVILICVTVALVTVEAAPAVSMIFAYAADGAIAMAKEGFIDGFIIGGVLHYIQTGNLNDSFKAGLLAGSEGFKWGAIGGALSGAAKESLTLHKWHKATNLSWDDVARIQRDSYYSIDFIKSVRSMDEYNVYKNADLVEYHIKDQRILLPKDFNFDFVDPTTGLTNRELLKKGYNPVDPQGKTYQWHHVGQKQDSPLALLTESQHTQYDAILHDKSKPSEVHGGENDTIWNKTKKNLNKLLGESNLDIFGR